MTLISLSRTDEADFESVVVVRANHENGIQGLKGLNYCHPGFFYDRTERWSERFLKHFERTIAPPQCEKKDSWSPAEIETETLANWFNQACRPGSWSNDVEEDARLSKKSSSLDQINWIHHFTYSFQRKNTRNYVNCARH